MAAEETTANAESILQLTKKTLGIEPDYTHFDMELVVFINSAFSVLHQIGLGASGGFRISGADEKWSAILGARTDLEMVKDYVYSRVRLAFDAPANSFGIEAIKQNIAELTFYINIAVDSAISSYGDVYIFESDADEFPEGASEGSLGWNPATGNIWRNSNG